MNHSWNVKCLAEKDVIAADETEKCLVQTQKVEENLSSQHQDKLDDHTTKSSEQLEKLKESWTQKCESEKDSLRDTLEDEFDTEQRQLQDDLAAEHDEAMAASTAALKEECSAEQAEFK